MSQLCDRAKQIIEVICLVEQNPHHPIFNRRHPLNEQCRLAYWQLQTELLLLQGVTDEHLKTVR